VRGVAAQRARAEGGLKREKGRNPQGKENSIAPVGVGPGWSKTAKKKKIEGTGKK